MSSQRHAGQVDELSREVDMLVYRLEGSAPDERDALLEERRQLRRELERLRDNLTDLARAMEL